MKNPRIIYMNKYAIYGGIAAGVFAIAGGMVFATANQQAHMGDNVVPSQASLEGSLSSDTGLGPVLNKEKWHEDPFADEAAEIREQAGQ